MSTYLLIWYVLRDRSSAVLGGLLAMLSGPVLLHARDHLDLLFAGCVPFFLWAWLRLLDRPSLGRTGAAVGTYLLVALCSPYYVVFVVLPALLALVWRVLGFARLGAWGAVRTRIGGALAFALVSGPLVLLAYAPHLWAMRQGYSIERPLDGFIAYGAPLWSYVAPTSYQGFSKWVMPFDVYQAAGIPDWELHERSSYLGIVALLLLGYALVNRVQFPLRGYWWTVVVLLVVLGCGAYWQVGEHSIALPALWLKQHFPGFQLVRVPARFNVFVALITALIAASGARHLLARVRPPWQRNAVFGGLVLLALADLAIVPYPSAIPPKMPRCYDVLKQINPKATLLEVPQYPSGGSLLTTWCSYWQSHHRLTTSAGYTGQSNFRYDNLITWNSPFLFASLTNPNYLDDPDDFLNPRQTAGGTTHHCADILQNSESFTTSFDDFVWLYMTAHNYHHIVLHHTDAAIAGTLALERLKDRLRTALIYEDETTLVYALDRLPPPRRPVLLLNDGWRPGFDHRPIRVAEQTAHIVVYNPDSERDLTLSLSAQSFRNPRTVRLHHDNRELALWQIPPAWELSDGDYPAFSSPSFRLPAGLSVLTLTSDSDDTPTSLRQAAFQTDRNPYSLRVGAIAFGVVE